MARGDDRFVLYDLRVEVVGSDRPMVCNHQVGDYFELSGENLRLPPGQTFPIYALAALLPLLPAKQRRTHANDWMTTDTEVACPDPNCGGRFRIVRLRPRVFRHDEVSAVPLPGTARKDRAATRAKRARQAGVAVPARRPGGGRRPDGRGGRR